MHFVGAFSLIRMIFKSAQTAVQIHADVHFLGLIRMGVSGHTDITNKCLKSTDSGFQRLATMTLGRLTFFNFSWIIIMQAALSLLGETQSVTEGMTLRDQRPVSILIKKQLSNTNIFHRT